DGLITNVSLVLGVAGAGSSHQSVVRLVGVAGLLAGAFSMAAGELVSVRAQAELVQRELDVERNELATEPESELAELTSMYTERGVPEDDARTVARILSANHDLALDTHARLELGIDPNQQASPTVAAVSSFAAFSIGAIIPLLPWFFSKGLTAVLLSIALGAAGALVLGGLIGSSTGRGVLRTALRQLAAVTVAAGITYGVGSLFGVGTT
ncbi:MAG: VIT1/CCC1 transporter family protein, partial [Acidimicrobiaceae bacterium]|nr:VIT1/CCC1 transporter family protein [Acidimicrobiaceae bacterium]